MPARLLTLSDAPAVRALWLAAVPSLSWWPAGVAPDLDAAHEISLVGAIPLGYESGGVLRGFFLVRRTSIPTAYPAPEARLLQSAWQLWLWIVQGGLSLAAYRAALDNLFDGPGGWFTRVSGHLCWGELPYDLIPARARNYLDTHFPEHYDRMDGAVRWRCWLWVVP